MLTRHLVKHSLKTRRWYSSLRAPDMEVDNMVIGAGVVGLAIGENLTRNRPLESTFVVEKNKRVGEETSARNSEVIHAGLYYPEDSLKTKLCIKGNHMLYDLVNKISNIPYNKLGKWIVAQNQDQHEYLEGMHEKATRLGVPTYFIDQKRANEMEPNIKAHSVLVSSSTGIVDSHNLMDYLEQQISETGDVALNTAVRSIQPSEKGYLLEVATPSDSQDTILVLAKRVFNSAGLHADKVSNMLLGENAYKLYYARGHYYSSSSSSYGISHLIYPCPEKNLAGLGTHLTLDMAGCIKFGPDVQYTDSPYDYSVPENDEHKAAFVNAIQQYLPSLDPNKINPDYSGIRPKLAGPGEPFKDFIIKEEPDYKNFYSLVGIESPGLTSALAIADYVCSMIDT